MIKELEGEKGRDMAGVQQECQYMMEKVPNAAGQAPGRPRHRAKFPYARHHTNTQVK